MLAFVPEQEEFSIRHLHEAVAGIPELVCFSADGYTLFRSTHAKGSQLPANKTATEIWRQADPDRTQTICGRAFLAHPSHIPTYWREIYHERGPIRRLRRLFNQTCVQVA